MASEVVFTTDLMIYMCHLMSWAMIFGLTLTSCNPVQAQLHQSPAQARVQDVVSQKEGRHFRTCGGVSAI